MILFWLHFSGFSNRITRKIIFSHCRLEQSSARAVCFLVFCGTWNHADNGTTRGRDPKDSQSHDYLPFCDIAVQTNVYMYVFFKKNLHITQQKEYSNKFDNFCALSITKTRLFKYIENFTSKNWKFSDKKDSDIFHISAQNIDCRYSLEPPRRGGSNEYPQSMFWAEVKKKNNVYPCKPQFYYIKVGFKGSKLYRHVFVMSNITVAI